jgi:hypothetical protein
VPTLTLPEQHGSGPSLCEEASGGEPGFPIGDRSTQNIAGYEAMNIIRKGQIQWLPKGDAAGQKRFVEHMFGIAA